MALEHIFVVRVDKIPKLLNEYSVFSFCLKQPLPDAIKQIFANSVHTFHFFFCATGKESVPNTIGTVPVPVSYTHLTLPTILRV